MKKDAYPLEKYLLQDKPEPLVVSATVDFQRGYQMIRCLPAAISGKYLRRVITADTEIVMRKRPFRWSLPDDFSIIRAYLHLLYGSVERFGSVEEGFKLLSAIASWGYVLRKVDYTNKEWELISSTTDIYEFEQLEGHIYKVASQLRLNGGLPTSLIPV